VGAPEKLLDRHCIAICLHYSHLDVDAVVSDADLNRLSETVHKTHSYTTKDFEVRTLETQSKFIVSNSCDEITRGADLAYAFAHLAEGGITSNAPIEGVELFEVI
jgi:hypothetical protein